MSMLLRQIVPEYELDLMDLREHAKLAARSRSGPPLSPSDRSRLRSLDEWQEERGSRGVLGGVRAFAGLVLLGGLFA